MREDKRIIKHISNTGLEDKKKKKIAYLYAIKKIKLLILMLLNRCKKNYLDLNILLMIKLFKKRKKKLKVKKLK